MHDERATSPGPSSARCGRGHTVEAKCPSHTRDSGVDETLGVCHFPRCIHFAKRAIYHFAYITHFLYILHRFEVRVFLQEPDMAVHIPKGAMHNFTKLTVDDINRLLRLMERWDEWDVISPGVQQRLHPLECHLKKLSALAQTAPPSALRQNFGTVAGDWYVTRTNGRGLFSEVAHYSHIPRCILLPGTTQASMEQPPMENSRTAMWLPLAHGFHI